MKKLQNRLSENNRLSSQEQASIKGGKRLICSSISGVTGKMSVLKEQGISYTLEISTNGDYCLEW